MWIIYDIYRNLLKDWAEIKCTTMAKSNGASSNASALNATNTLGSLVTGSTGTGPGQRQGNAGYTCLNIRLNQNSLKLLYTRN